VTERTVDLDRGPEYSGTVVEFDAVVGLGVVESSTGERHAFHCIEIADGTREIAIGTAVAYDLLGKFGRYEAANVQRS
jgi:CspA family cold shock protein